MPRGRAYAHRGRLASRPGMLIRLGFEIAYRFVQPTPMVVMLDIHGSRSHDIAAAQPPCGGSCASVCTATASSRAWSMAPGRIVPMLSALQTTRSEAGSTISTCSPPSVRSLVL